MALCEFRQFEVPVSVIQAYDRVFDPGATCHLDFGALLYGILLAAWNRELGAEINGHDYFVIGYLRDLVGDAR